MIALLRVCPPFFLCFSYVALAHCFSSYIGNTLFCRYISYVCFEGSLLHVFGVNCIGWDGWYLLKPILVFPTPKDIRYPVFSNLLVDTVIDLFQEPLSKFMMNFPIV